MKKEVLIFIIIIFAVLISFLQGTITGNSIIFGQAVKTEFCEESNIGDLYIKGNCTDKNSTYEDYCLNNSVIEFFCRNNVCTEVEYRCKYGCVNGSCIALCEDSDGGINEKEKGIVIYGGDSYTDYCRENWLAEYYCDGSVKNKGILCEKCSDGRCV